MALAHSPKIVTDGLVFAYDMGNSQKSWKGAPTTNLASGSFFTGNGNFTVNQNVSDTMPDGTLGIARELNAQTVTDVNRTVSIGSYSLTPGETYTLSFYVKNINCSGFGGNLYSPTLGRVIGSITYPTTNTLTYVRVVTTFVVPNEGPNPVVLSPQVFRDAGFGLFRLCYLMLEQKTFATPFVSSARTNTQAIVDLMSTNTITASSLTYAADNTFSFNGSSNYIDSGPVALTGTSTQSLTWACWVSPATASGDIINMVSGGWNMCPIYASGQIFNGKVWSSAALPADFSFTLNQYYYLVLTRNSATNTNSFYVNGRLVASQTGATYSSSGNANNHYFGRAGSQATNTHFNGKIPSGQIYTKALTAAEVQQNFNALRGRYGI